MTPTRIIRFIGIAGLIGWFGMVGWVAKTTQAQNGGASAAARGRRWGSIERTPSRRCRSMSPQTTAQGEGPGVSSVQPGESTTEPMPAPAGVGQAPRGRSPAHRPRRTATSRQPCRDRSAKDSFPPIAPTGDAAAPPTDDPEKSAQAFVERSRKEAEAHLKALTTEAAQLRSRLAKLESGIKRWQTLVNALKGTQATALSEDASPSDLEPLPQAATGDPRADKRVKWASSNPPAPAEDALDSPAPTAAPAREPAPAPYARPANTQSHRGSCRGEAGAFTRRLANTSLTRKRR